MKIWPKNAQITNKSVFDSNFKGGWLWLNWHETLHYLTPTELPKVWGGHRDACPHPDSPSSLTHTPVIIIDSLNIIKQNIKCICALIFRYSFFTPNAIAHRSSPPPQHRAPNMLKISTIRPVVRKTPESKTFVWLTQTWSSMLFQFEKPKWNYYLTLEVGEWSWETLVFTRWGPEVWILNVFPAPASLFSFDNSQK